MMNRSNGSQLNGGTQRANGSQNGEEEEEEKADASRTTTATTTTTTAAATRRISAIQSAGQSAASQAEDRAVALVPSGQVASGGSSSSSEQASPVPTALIADADILAAEAEARRDRDLGGSSGRGGGSSSSSRRHSFGDVAEASRASPSAVAAPSQEAVSGGDDAANRHNPPRAASAAPATAAAAPAEHEPDPIDAYGFPLRRRYSDGNEQDLYDPIRRQSVGGSYGLVPVSFARSVRNLSLPVEVEGGGSGSREYSLDTETVGYRTNRRTSQGSNRSGRSSRSGASTVPAEVGVGYGSSRGGHRSAALPRRQSSSAVAGSPSGRRNKMLLAGRGKAKSSRAALGSYLIGRKEYGQGLSDSDDGSHDNYDYTCNVDAGESAPRRDMPTNNRRESILEVDNEDDESECGESGDGTTALMSDVTSSVMMEGEREARPNAVSLWERVQMWSGKSLPKRPSQTRLDLLGDLGRPYIRQTSSEATAPIGAEISDTGNATWDAAVPTDTSVAAQPSLTRRRSDFRRWSTDTDDTTSDSNLPNDVGASVRSSTGRLGLRHSTSIPLQMSGKSDTTDSIAGDGSATVKNSFQGMSFASHTGSVGSCSTSASTVLAGTAAQSGSVTRKVNGSVGHGSMAAEMTIPESSEVVPPAPVVYPEAVPQSPPSPPTTCSSTAGPAGGSAFLPDVGIVSVSAASAAGIMQGRHLAVLDLTSGRHFINHRSQSIGFLAPSYTNRLSQRLSVGQRSRSARNVFGGSISSSTVSTRSRSIGLSSQSASTYSSSRKSSLSTRKSSMSTTRRSSMGHASLTSVNSVLSVFDRDKAGSGMDSGLDNEAVHASTGLAGSYVHGNSTQKSDEHEDDVGDADSNDAVSVYSKQNDNDDEEQGTVYSDPSLALRRPSIHNRICGSDVINDPNAPLPVLEEFSLGDPDISLDDDVRGPYRRRHVDHGSSHSGNARETGMATSGSVGNDSSAFSSIGYSGLDQKELEEERLNPRSLRYLPQILRESYACPNYTVRRRASMKSVDSVEKSMVAAAAAIELRMRLRRPRALPECRDIRGSVLILDLSGFTALGERLKKEHGDSEGAAEFAHRVDTILSTMVEHVYDCGGDVLMFAGDALICLFEEKPLEPLSTNSAFHDDIGEMNRAADDTNEARKEQTTARVRSCCMRVFGSADLEGKDFTIHGGSAHGAVRCYFLGRPSTKPGDCTFVVSGAPLRAASHYLNKAGRGEIWIEGMSSPMTKDMVAGAIDSRPLLKEEPPLPNFTRRQSWKLTAELLDLHSDEEDEETAAELVMNHDVHPFAKAYLGSLAARRSDHAQDGMSILLNELRPVAIVFAGLHDLTNVDAQDYVLLRKMNSVFVSLSRITHSCDGAVKEMSFDDKGCVFISVFGAHSHGANPCFDATMCAMRMQDALKKLEFHNFSLGVSFGDCFCGEVGPEIRADYVVMGTEVNTAARLMGKAPREGILVSKRIFTNSKKYISFLKSEKIKVKGIDEPFHAYIPQDRIVQTSVVDGAKKDAQPFVLMPSRQIDMKTMVNAIDGVLKGRPKTVLVCGGPFLGKSRMIWELGTRATAKGFTILQSFRTSLDCFTSYFPFRQITSTALKKCAARVTETEDSDTCTELEAVQKLLKSKILTKTDRMMLGSIIPSISDAQLISLLPKNPKTMTKAIVDSFLKVLEPLQPAVLVFEGDGWIDPSSWSLIADLMLRAVKQCPRLMLVISSRNAPAVPSAMMASLSDDIIHVNLAPFEKYETEIYVKVLLGVREKGIGIDEKMLDAVHHRANGCPQFIEYIVRWALDKNLIEYVESRNSMSFKSLDAHSDDEIIPRELSSIVLAAFNDLSPILWDALKIASCIGYSFDANVYSALTADLDFIPKIKKLASSYDAFEKSDGNRYKWKHQAVYEAVKSLLINSQRQKIHSMIVEVFERNVSSDEIGEAGKGDVHRLLARHCSLAQKWGSAFNQYMEAGKRAEEIYNFTEATRMYEEALNMQEKMNPKPLLQSRLLPTVKLGNCLRELARYEEAEAVLTRCLKEAERAMDEIDGDEQMYVHVLTSLATLYQNESKYNDAKKLYEKALPIARNIQESRSSLWLAGQIAGYAEILRKSGDLPSAEALHREALDIRNLAAEEGSCTELELAISFTQLGCTLFGLKRYSEAYSKHRMALYSRFKYLDFSHGLVSESLNYCAESLCSLDRGCEGIPLAMHAVKIRRVVFGTAHPAYAHALSVLASCYYASGRSFDARDFLDECINICESAFPKNHANMIPNLMNYGKVLRSTGDLRKARDVYDRAITIHQINFKEGQRAAELEKCTEEVHEINIQIAAESETADESKESPAQTALANSGDYFSGNPIIVITDVGRDVDDEYCLVLMSALKRMHLLDPIAVIATLAPQDKRAFLARGILDSLGLPGVPVGIGSRGGVADGEELEVYDSDYSRPCPCIVENGVDLMVEALKSSPDHSVQILVIAALTDVATVMENHEDLFVQKVKEVVIMGGLKPMDDKMEFVEPDSAYNNNCDMDAAKYVYRRCQELGMPTLTISRYAAYGCPVAVAVLEDLCRTEHMAAHNIKSVSVASINSLWKKVNYPATDPRREKLPARCDRTWFCRTFFGEDDVDKKPDESIWPLLENLNMYDPLALMACVPAYRQTNFLWETKYVNGKPHRIAGVSENHNGIVDAKSMSDEMASLFGMAFRNSLQNVC